MSDALVVCDALAVCDALGVSDALARRVAECPARAMLPLPVRA